MNDSQTLLPCVELEPSAPVRASVIWLHGLGANGHDFEPIVPELGLDDLGIRFVFPHAPSIPVTLNFGTVMPAWYDITELNLERKHDEAGIRRSGASVEALIAREKERGVPASRILLAGFSQGGAVALFSALRHAERLAGAVALSTYLVCDDSLEAERTDANRDLPIFQAHGTLDPMVPVARGMAARERLQECGYTVEWHDYPMQHQVCLEEIQALSTWMRARLEE